MTLERILTERKPSNVRTLKVFFEYEEIGYYQLEKYNELHAVTLV